MKPDQFFYLSLRHLLSHTYWMAHDWRTNGPAIGHMRVDQALFTQRSLMEQLHRGNGNKAKRKLGIDPAKNNLAPWIRMAFTTQN